MKAPTSRLIRPKGPALCMLDGLVGFMFSDAILVIYVPILMIVVDEIRSSNNVPR